ncbi:MAG: hypothetical protein AABW64_01320 [Nanoarchaeota archaeon]
MQFFGHSFQKPEQTHTFFQEPSHISQIQGGLVYLVTQAAKHLPEGTHIILYRPQNDRFYLYVQGRSSFVGGSRKETQSLLTRLEKKIKKTSDPTIHFGIRDGDNPSALIFGVYGAEFLDFASKLRAALHSQSEFPMQYFPF